MFSYKGYVTTDPSLIATIGGNALPRLSQLLILGLHSRESQSGPPILIKSLQSVCISLFM